MKKIILIPLFLSTIISAEEVTSKPLADDLKLSLGAYIVGNNKTEFIAENHDGLALSLDLQNALDMKTDAVSVYFDGYYRFSPHHRIEFGYKGITSKGETHNGGVYTLDNPLNPLDPIVIDLSGTIESKLNIKIARVAYTYSFYHSEKTELGLSIGLHRTAIDFDLGASLGSSGGDFTLVIAPPIPLLGVRFSYDIFPSWEVHYNYDLIALVSNLNLPESPEIEGISGYMSDMTLATEYRFFENFSGGLALNSMDLNFKFLRTDVDVGINNQVLGFVAYASFRY